MSSLTQVSHKAASAAGCTVTPSQYSVLLCTRYLYSNTLSSVIYYSTHYIVHITYYILRTTCPLTLVYCYLYLYSYYILRGVYSISLVPRLRPDASCLAAWRVSTLTLMRPIAWSIITTRCLSAHRPQLLSTEHRTRPLLFYILYA